MAGNWEAQEVARYIAETCLNLTQLAVDAHLDALAQALEDARQMALAVAQSPPGD